MHVLCMYVCPGELAFYGCEGGAAGEALAKRICSIFLIEVVLLNSSGATEEPRRFRACVRLGS
jgi:hypothetical protein